jgi:hypothetical protein
VGEIVGDDVIVAVLGWVFVDVCEGFAVVDGAAVLVGVMVRLGVFGMVDKAMTVFVEVSVLVFAPSVE